MPALLYANEVWGSNWSIYSVNILKFQKFVDQMRSMCLILPSIKIKSGPTAPMKKQTYGSTASFPMPHSSHTASLKDLIACYLRDDSEVIQPEVVPFLEGIPGAIFQQDNVRPHVAKTARDFCSAEHMQLLPWPAFSPDMSPIKHEWDLVGRCVSLVVPVLQLQKANFCCAYKQIELRSYRKTIGNEPRNFKPWLNDVDNPTLSLVPYTTKFCTMYRGQTASLKSASTNILTMSMAVVAEWSRYRIVAGFVTSSSPAPLKTRHAEERYTLNLSRAETSSHWRGVVVRRKGCQLRCRPRH
ncbi:uncharacterized protein TNCV_4660671 [Trichonephila clavipes]|uniref:Uncharacterized protein n=1 Tax=Trichonephila clavipes TaxID=2585209 RepID=A0A8X6VIU3_TRICX|nr:uncharacterized protein TNCV_4660671 [Trichonephila clavipes]